MRHDALPRRCPWPRRHFAPAGFSTSAHSRSRPSRADLAGCHETEAIGEGAPFPSAEVDREGECGPSGEVDEMDEVDEASEQLLPLGMGRIVARGSSLAAGGAVGAPPASRAPLARDPFAEAV